MEEGPQAPTWLGRILSWAFVIGHGERMLKEKKQEQRRTREERGKIGVFPLRSPWVLIYSSGQKGSGKVGGVLQLSSRESKSYLTRWDG